VIAPRERIGSAFSSASHRQRSGRNRQRQSSAHSVGSVTLSIKSNEKPASKTQAKWHQSHSRSISSLRDESKRKKERELFKENIKQLARLQNAKASFDVVKWEKAEKKRQKLLGKMKLYPEPPIAEFAKKPPMSKKTKRNPSVGPLGSPRESNNQNRLPNLALSRGTTPASRAYRSVMPSQKAASRINSQHSGSQYVQHPPLYPHLSSLKKPSTS